VLSLSPKSTHKVQEAHLSNRYVSQETVVFMVTTARTLTASQNTLLITKSIITD